MQIRFMQATILDPSFNDRFPCLPCISQDFLLYAFQPISNFNPHLMTTLFAIHIWCSHTNPFPILIFILIVFFHHFSLDYKYSYEVFFGKVGNFIKTKTNEQRQKAQTTKITDKERY